MVRRVGFGGEKHNGSDPKASPTPDGRAERPNRPRAHPARPLLYLFLLIPLGFSLLGFRLLIDAALFNNIAQPAEGVVVSVEANSGSDGTTYRPTVEYMTWEGEVWQAPTHIAASGYDYRIGERIEIIYDPTDPDEVRINGLMSLWGLPVIFFAAGTAMLVLFSMVWLRRTRADGNSSPD